jgi:hypothetical protein
VTRLARTALVLAVAALATAAGVLLISREDGGDGEQAPATVEVPASLPPGPRSAPKSGGHRPSGHGDSTQEQVQQAVRESRPARLDTSQRQVAQVVFAYVAALNDRDGARACALFVPGALSSVDFPRDRGTCPDSLSASIGYRDRRGFPVYERSRVARVGAVAIEGQTARVTATTVTRFADNREPSVEDDLVYLRRQGDEWRIAKPSATLYRAIGVGNIPPEVLTPP